MKFQSYLAIPISRYDNALVKIHFGRSRLVLASAERGALGVPKPEDNFLETKSSGFELILKPPLP